MTANNEISPTPNYWDGESALFITDTIGTVRKLEESGDPLAIAERMWAEATK